MEWLADPAPRAGRTIAGLRCVNTGNYLQPENTVQRLVKGIITGFPEERRTGSDALLLVASSVSLAKQEKSDQRLLAAARSRLRANASDDIGYGTDEWIRWAPHSLLVFRLARFSR